MKGLLTFFIGLVSLIVPVAGFADQEQTDPEKLQRVYAMYAEYKEKFPAVELIKPINDKSPIVNYLKKYYHFHSLKLKYDGMKKDDQ